MFRLPPKIHALARRLAGSAVFWSWIFNFLRMASGLLLLPLLLRVLSKPDLGMYYVFLSLNAVVALFDLCFSPGIGRFVTYAMGGATRLAAEGLAAEPPKGEPNYPLLRELLQTARVLYGYLSVGALVLVGVFGSWLIWQKVGETSSPGFTWLAWAVNLAAVTAETYFSVWNTFLRNMNQVLAAMRIAVLAYAARLALACALLLLGGGLLALPAASFATCFIIRNLSRRGCLRALSSCPAPRSVDWRAHLRTLWPNSWRLGLYFTGAYLSTNANVLLCTARFGLEANAQYGLSLQVINVCAGLAMMWTMVKWPLIGQLIARRETESLRAVFWPRLWLHLGTLVVLAGAAIVLGPGFIRFIGSDKQMLPLLWLVLMGLNSLLEQHCSAWNSLIAMGNRLPMLWPSLATNAAGLGLNLLVITFPGAEAGFLVLGPLLAGLVFNYWYWPRYGARTLGMTWWQFVRSGFASKWQQSRGGQNSSTS